MNEPVSPQDNIKAEETALRLAARILYACLLAIDGYPKAREHRVNRIRHGNHRTTGKQQTDNFQVVWPFCYDFVFTLYFGKDKNCTRPFQGSSAPRLVQRGRRVSAGLQSKCCAPQ